MSAWSFDTLYISYELDYHSAKNLLSEIVRHCNKKLQNIVATYYAAAYVRKNGLESVVILLGFRKSFKLIIPNQIELRDELSKLLSWEENDNCMAKPFFGIADWKKALSEIEDLVLNYSISGHAAVFSNIDKYVPAFEQNLYEGRKLIYNLSLGEVIAYFLNRPDVANFNAMMNKTSNEVHISISINAAKYNPSFSDFSILGKKPSVNKPVATFAHYRNIESTHKRNGIPVIKGTSKNNLIISKHLEASGVDAVYKAFSISSVPNNKIFYVSLCEDGKIRMDLIEEN